MGFFNRLSTLLRANLNALIATAENPEKILEQCILDMRDSLVEARKQVAVAIADEKRLKAQLEGEMKKARAWEKKAIIAVKAGKDQLAKDALIRKNEHDNLAAGYQREWEMQKAGTDKLKGALRGLQKKIEEAQRRKNLLIARDRRNKAHKAIQETLGNINTNNAASTFDRMAEKIEREESIVLANQELMDEENTDLAAEIDALEHDYEAEDALTRLKHKLNMHTPEQHVREEEPVHVSVHTRNETPSRHAVRISSVAKDPNTWDEF